MSGKITDLKAREILDCRGWPTVQADVYVDNQLLGRADVPQGRSTGTHEAYVLTDGDPNRYRGLGVRKAVQNIEGPIRDVLVGRDVTEQRAIDFALIDLDGTPNKRNLGANAILGASLAVARAGAASAGVPLYRYLNPFAHVLPVPLMNFLNGGKLTANELEIQEFIIMPVGAENYDHAMQMTTEINEHLRELVIARYGILATNTGDEGGFATPMKGIWEPFEFLQKAVEKAGYKAGFGEDVVYGLDCASSHWHDKATGLYMLDGVSYERDALIELYKEVASKYPLGSVEDPLDEEDFDGFVAVTKALPQTQIVGDDLFVTNVERLRVGVARGAANAMLFKVNQIGSLSQAFDSAEYAYRHGYGVQVSERSGETEDPLISDLVVALNGGQIKTGMPIRSERTSKHNRLLQIEGELGSVATYAGHHFRRPR
ncbi:phosphopyruvate hydratase [Paraburkholderia caribensis]|uniref:phosphopyruvate hydratase n=1 Tax=Paraburkholderia caribensis TaxID=75105 RepID=UPI00072275BD|nr:phosphopyruvate hydratase [Paraburkholderia caribensis]ALP68529.1 enolase [Paraburkholderia caribensis]AUT57885.1 phosphopyruvate hydratase [Paraburkholderia caribensis]